MTHKCIAVTWTRKVLSYRFIALIDKRWISTKRDRFSLSRSIKLACMPIQETWCLWLTKLNYTGQFSLHCSIISWKNFRWNFFQESIEHWASGPSAQSLSLVSGLSKSDLQHFLGTSLNGNLSLSQGQLIPQAHSRNTAHSEPRRHQEDCNQK